MSDVASRSEALRALRRLCRGTPSLVSATDNPRLSMGIPSLDLLLPQQGPERGSLIEWQSSVAGSGAAVLALQGVRSAVQRKKVWAVVDPAGEFHAAAVSGWGLSMESLLLIRPSSRNDALWAVEQCLRCSAIGVTWTQSDQVSNRVVQRWKIAVEAGRGLGVLFRSAQQARQASWVDIRWLVQPRPATISNWRRLKVDLVSCRGAFSGGSVEMDVNDATGDVRLVSDLAGAASATRAAGA